MRIALLVLMGLHGIAHLVGFAESWQLSTTESTPYKTTVLSGRVDLGAAGIRAAGVLWLLAALAFVLVAVGAAMNAPWWFSMAIATAVASLVLCLVWWPEARIGVPINVALIVTLVLGRRLGWL